jgi:hypothetical protein
MHQGVASMDNNAIHAAVLMRLGVFFLFGKDFL